MNCGIYCYRDLLNNNSIVYIGKDSDIGRNKRHKDHIKPTNYDAQQINRVLQNNPERYDYEVLKEWEYDEYNPNLLNALEMIYIKRYNPRFNYTIGGDGIRGFKHSKETKQKISESLKGENHPLYGKSPSEETRMKMSKNNARYWKGKHLSEETKRKLSEANKGENAPLWKDYPRIIKCGIRNGKQRYGIKYDGKVIKESIYLEKLQKELNSLINEVN